MVSIMLLLIVSLIVISLLVAGFVLKRVHSDGVPAFAIAFFVAIFGFGPIALTVTKETKYYSYKRPKFESAKTANSVLISIPDINMNTVLTDAKTFNTIDKVNEIYVKVDYNAYGSEIGNGRTIVLP